MIDMSALLMVIAKHVRRKMGEKSLNELIAMGIAVYAEIASALPKTRNIHAQVVDLDIVADVLEELAQGNP